MHKQFSPKAFSGSCPVVRAMIGKGWAKERLANIPDCDFSSHRVSLGDVTAHSRVQV